VPETVRDENGLEVAGRMGDTSIHGCIGSIKRHAKLSECWHSVYRLDERGQPPLHEEKTDMRQMIGPVERGLSLMLRF
jgi:hypothetical protein